VLIACKFKMPFDKPISDINENSSVTLCSYRTASDQRADKALSQQRLAVEIRRVRLSYGRGKKTKTILSGIDLTVPEGAIYGLLGPSGCGKTTLLRCVVGRLKPSSGYVKIFGFRPGDPGSQIPGPGIGYMPQEIAVYEDFSIEETLIYFGRLYRLKKTYLRERIEFLLAFLDLPHKNRLVQNLSGGQKRRVSLAAALVHNPPLLILDEPTVGVDPLLRQRQVFSIEVFCFLFKFQLPSVFSIYSANNNYTLPQVPQLQVSSMSTINSNDGPNVIAQRQFSTMHDEDPDSKYVGKKVTFGQYISTIMALFWKNATRLRRNIPVLLFQFALPAIQVILFCICIGADPFNIPLAVVNHDTLGLQLGQSFLNKLDPYIVDKHNFDTVEEGKEAVRNGSMWGVLYIPEAFSLSLAKRILRGEGVDNDTISNSTIKVYPDLTNQQISYTMERAFKDAFQAFAREALIQYGRNPALAEFPLALGEPVYGEIKHQGYLEYMAPGVVVSISYIMATGLTALAFILERRDGLFERSLVAGVDTLQILIAHSLTQLIVMVVQITFVLLFTFVVFDIPSRGPFYLVILLLLLQGCTGMAFGLVVSACCHQENTAVMMILGTFYPNLILSGIIWPLEAMPYWIRWFSYIQPQTLPTESLRHVLSRGWNFDEPGVFIGFFVTIGWMAFFLVAAAIIFKYNK
ncbi:ATP-binding cassette transporter sub-family H 88708-like protein, partial [Dinothrombium tinctorium]